jgi:hypothetical protein
MRTPGPTAIPILELPRPREKTGGGGRPVSLATRKVKRPRKRRKTKTKTKTADVVVKAQEQAAHRQEEESRWAAEVQAAKKGAQALQEEMAQVKENARTQQEGDCRWAAVKRRQLWKEEGVYVLDGTGRELGVGVRKDFRFLVVKETYAAFVFDGTGWWDHAYWHDEGWYWGMSPSRIYKYRDRQR